jgi:hypothetical protein
MLVGLAGQARSGKSTLATMLADVTGLGRAGFATPLREAAHIAFRKWLNPDHFTSGKDKPLPDNLDRGLSHTLRRLGLASQVLRTLNASGFSLELPPENSGKLEAHYTKDLSMYLDGAKTPRDILCALGTFYRNAVGPDYWVRRLEERIDRYRTEEGLILDDVRFPAEREWIRATGGCLILVQRKGLRRPPPDAHVSELSLGRASEYDYRVKAKDGDIVELLSRGIHAVGQHVLKALEVEAMAYAHVKQLGERGVAALNDA